MPDTGQYNQFPIDWQKLNASKVPYSNATSGLSATDAQNAIDELASEKQETLTAGDGITISSDTISTDNDATLTSEVKPAQAKAVGEALSAQETATEEALYTKAPVITDTASGAIATFPDGADGYPLKECVVNIEAVQSGSGDPSPDNIRPITGWSSAKVTRTGKNLWDEETLSGYYSSRTGAYVYNAGQLCSKNFIPVKPNTQYLFKKLVNLGDIIFYNASKEFISSLNNRQANAVFTTPENAYYLQINLGSVYGASYNNDVGINYPHTDTSYHPYVGTTFTISLGDTRYGAVLDVTRGKLRVTELYFDFSSVSWVAQAKSRWFYNGLQSTIKKPSTTAVATEAISDTFKSVSNYDIFSDESLIGLAINNDGSVVIRNGSTTTEPTGHMVYPLATPIEVDLTPTEITTLLGTNNLWSDTGDIEVEYCADTKRYIQKVISALS